MKGMTAHLKWRSLSVGRSLHAMSTVKTDETQAKDRCDDVVLSHEDEGRGAVEAWASTEKAANTR